MISSLADKTILIVEDEALLVLHVQQLLEEAGFRTLTAHNADAAIELLKTGADVDVLLTDVNMPGSMDGIGLANRVREEWPPVHIAVISGNTVPVGLPAGSRFFRKPVSDREVVAELRMLLEHAGAGD